MFWARHTPVSQTIQLAVLLSLDGTWSDMAVVCGVISQSEQCVERGGHLQTTLFSELAVEYCYSRMM